jgi:hypothetical protein
MARKGGSVTVWKFTLSVKDEQEIAMPSVSEPLHVARQNGELCLWAHVRPDTPIVLRKFYVTGTGNPTPDAANYIGTVRSNPFVWHIWEEQV